MGVIALKKKQLVHNDDTKVICSLRIHHCGLVYDIKASMEVHSS